MRINTIIASLSLNLKGTIRGTSFLSLIALIDAMSSFFISKRSKSK